MPLFTFYVIVEGGFVLDLDVS